MNALALALKTKVAIDYEEAQDILDRHNARVSATNKRRLVQNIKGTLAVFVAVGFTVQEKRCMGESPSMEEEHWIVSDKKKHPCLRLILRSKFTTWKVLPGRPEMPYREWEIKVEPAMYPSYAFGHSTSNVDKIKELVAEIMSKHV